MDENELSNKIIGAALEVHKTLGPGLMESAYQACLCQELRIQGLKIEKEKDLPVEYKGFKLDCGYRMDIVVEDKVIVEVKALEKVLPIHEAQLLTYLKLTGLKLGLLINFNTPRLKDGIKRLVLGLEEK